MVQVVKPISLAKKVVKDQGEIAIKSSEATGPDFVVSPSSSRYRCLTDISPLKQDQEIQEMENMIIGGGERKLV
jgi:hypothetical protein